MPGMQGERAPLLAGSGKSQHQHHNLAGLSTFRFRLICASVWSTTFFVALDSTVVATLLTPIGSAFHASNLVSWLGTAYLLSLCCFTPIYGRLSDLIGRRGALMIGISAFTLGTIGCAIAPSMNALIAARAIAGMGGGGIQSVAVITLTDLIDLRHRGLYQGYGNIAFGMGMTLGGPFGGWVSDTWGWRWAFASQVPLLIAAGIAVFVFMRYQLPGQSEDEPWRAKVARIDYLGSLTLLIAISSLLLPISMKTSTQKPDGSDYAWADPLIWGLLVVSVVFTLLFILVEAKFAIQPILPLSLLARRTPAAVAASLLVIVTNQFSLMYNIPLFFSAVQLKSASVAGAHLLPYTLCMGVGSLSAGWWMRRTGKYWYTGVISAVGMSLTGALLLLWKQKMPDWWTYISPLPAGLGYAGALTSTLVALMTNVTRVGKGEVAVATSMSYLFRTTGQVFGVAFSSAIIQSILQNDLSRTITGPGAADTIDRIRHSTNVILELPAAEQNAAVEAYDHALHVVFICNLVLAGLGILAMMCIKEEEMPEQQRIPHDQDDGDSDAD